MAGDARAERALLRGMIGMRFLMAAKTGTFCPGLCVVRIVTIRARGMRFHHVGGERFVPCMTSPTRLRPRAAQVVRVVAASATFMAARERSVTRNDRWTLAVTPKACAAHLGGGAVRRVAIEALLVIGSPVLGARAVMQVDLLMTTATSERFEAFLAMRLMAIEARLVGMYDYRGVRILSGFMAIEARVGLVEGDVRWGVAEVECCIEAQVAFEGVARSAFAAAAGACSRVAVMHFQVGVASLACASDRHLETPFAHSMTIRTLHPSLEMIFMARTESCHAPRRVDLSRRASFWRSSASGDQRRHRQADPKQNASDVRSG